MKSLKDFGVYIDWHGGIRRLWWFICPGFITVYWTKGCWDGDGDSEHYELLHIDWPLGERVGRAIYKFQRWRNK